jgi:8-oxo-dGTP diphosphatase
VVVDVANVMGARADGWWRDRAGAALRLCREVAALARRGYEGGEGGEPGPEGGEDGPVSAGEWVLVLEGKARAAAREFDSGTSHGDPPPLVRVLSAPGSGDDAIVGVVEEVVARGETCLVVTADRELRQRCQQRGASVTGPGWLLRML